MQKLVRPMGGGRPPPAPLDPPLYMYDVYTSSATLNGESVISVRGVACFFVLGFVKLQLVRSLHHSHTSTDGRSIAERDLYAACLTVSVPA